MQSLSAAGDWQKENIEASRRILTQILSDPRPVSFFRGNSEEEKTEVAFSYSASGPPSSRAGSVCGRVMREGVECFVRCFQTLFPNKETKAQLLSSLLGSSEDSLSDNKPIPASYLLQAALLSLSLPSISLPRILPPSPFSSSPSPLPWALPLTNTPSPAEDAQPLITPADTASSSSPCAPVSLSAVVNILIRKVVTPPLVGEGGSGDDRSRPLASPSNAFRSQVLSEAATDLICAVFSELATHKGSMLDNSRALLRTPSRYRSAPQEKKWITGNGATDAIAVQVSRPVVLAGATIYLGSGSYEYSLGLLVEETLPGSEKWVSVASVEGSVCLSPSEGSAAPHQVLFPSGVRLSPEKRYALKLAISGGNTRNGQDGVPVVVGPDGTTFSFSPCVLSRNGTCVLRGQIPSLLYYSCDQSSQSSESSQSMSNSPSSSPLAIPESSVISGLLDIAWNVLSTAQTLLTRIQADRNEFIEEEMIVIPSLPNSTRFQLSPMLGRLVAVSVLSHVFPLLQIVSELNRNEMGEEAPTYTAVVESPHPYPPSFTSVKRVVFPPSVLWMTLSFDPAFKLGQPTDSLNILIPTSGPDGAEESHAVLRAPLHEPNVLGLKDCIIPGNEVLFSLESSHYGASPEDGGSWGFRCTVTGQSQVLLRPEEGGAGGGEKDLVINLEKELVQLASLCCQRLYQAPWFIKDEHKEKEGDKGAPRDGAANDKEAPGFSEPEYSLVRPTLELSASSQVVLSSWTDIPFPFSMASAERSFLEDFISAASHSGGNRLGSHLQQEPIVDSAQCSLLPTSPIPCLGTVMAASGFTLKLSLVTRSQYGDRVNADGLEVSHGGSCFV
ncbi:unnamed protein product [Cyprideis torosa]|uniref:PHR domain-containing protein n=1 Tax=Cyprideis torosa TaxID=163714 RepID=A0A7R8ZQB4_9CRUS|nr:unnamed protein product [Cyprideis torosa]CAG0891688.1 unnamed protein product [Cyprideis torosa]